MKKFKLLLALTTFMFGTPGLSQTPFYEVGQLKDYQFDEFPNDDFTPTASVQDQAAHVLYNGESEVTYTMNLSDIETQVGSESFPDGINGNMDLEVSYDITSLDDYDYIWKIEILDNNDNVIDTPYEDLDEDPEGDLEYTGTFNINVGTSDVFKMKMYVDTYETSGRVIFKTVSLTDVTDYSTVSVNEHKNVEDNFNIYSFDNFIMVKSNDYSNYEMKVFNMNGQLVFETSTSGDVKQPIYNKGMYIVDFKSEKGNIRKRLVIQ